MDIFFRRSSTQVPRAQLTLVEVNGASELRVLVNVVHIRLELRCHVVDLVLAEETLLLRQHFETPLTAATTTVAVGVALLDENLESVSREGGMRCRVISTARKITRPKRSDGVLHLPHQGGCPRATWRCCRRSGWPTLGQSCQVERRAKIRICDDV